MHWYLNIFFLLFKYVNLIKKIGISSNHLHRKNYSNYFVAFLCHSKFSADKIISIWIFFQVSHHKALIELKIATDSRIFSLSFIILYFRIFYYHFKCETIGVTVMLSRMFYCYALKTMCAHIFEALNEHEPKHGYRTDANWLQSTTNQQENKINVTLTRKRQDDEEEKKNCELIKCTSGIATSSSNSGKHATVTVATHSHTKYLVFLIKMETFVLLRTFFFRSFCIHINVSFRLITHGMATTHIKQNTNHKSNQIFSSFFLFLFVLATSRFDFLCLSTGHRLFCLCRFSFDWMFFDYFF